MDGNERKTADKEASRHQAHPFAWQRVARRGTRCITRADASWRHLPLCICSASETQLAISSAGWLRRAVVSNPGVNSFVWWRGVSLSMLYDQHTKCGKPGEFGGKRSVGRSETGKG